MPETIKRITLDDLEKSLHEYWNTHSRFIEPKFFLVNSIDAFDLRKSVVTEFEVGRRILTACGLKIIRSDDIPNGEIYVV